MATNRIALALVGVLLAIVAVAIVLNLQAERNKQKVAAVPGGRQGENVGLEAGNIAPEIDGEDIDGKRFKLSDYRGKVVVLDFWGNW